MDQHEMEGAYNRALSKNISKAPYVPPAPVEVDYAVVRISSDNYIVARSHRLGSLNYDFVCECATQWEAHNIVEALNR
jgi:hypothetical protein